MNSPSVERFAACSQVRVRPPYSHVEMRCFASNATPTTFRTRAFAVQKSQSESPQVHSCVQVQGLLWSPCATTFPNSRRGFDALS